MKINKKREAKKGYWKDNEPRGLYLRVVCKEKKNQEQQKQEEESNETELHAKNNRYTICVSLNSEYWYRVQHFDLDDCSIRKVWAIIKDVTRECGRTLVPHTREESIRNSDNNIEVNDDNLEKQDTNDKQEETKTQSVVEYYRIAYLSPMQVNQLYYLFKHAFTKNGLSFSIRHTIGFDTSTDKCVKPPKKRRQRRRRRRRTQQPATASWQYVTTHIL